MKTKAYCVESKEKELSKDLVKMKGEYNNNEKTKEKECLAEIGKGVSDYGTNIGEGDEYVEGSIGKKIPYPKSVFFIITNEFCERFSYYGMKAVLTIYLKNILGYTEDKATVIYHVFSMLCYFTPVFGAMLADSILGKFKTILYLSVVYAVGNVVLSLAATTPLSLPIEAFSIAGLLLIAIGTGGIKPCVSAFGGDQFTLPQQSAQLASFFSIFYFSINAGSLLSTFITPIFRKDVKCFDADTCYPLAFGVPAVLMIVSLMVFVIGYRWYSIRKPDGNITVKVGKCISHALREKSKSNQTKDHWLDHASNKYDYELIDSIKTLLKILVLYIPLPVFWALFDQQGSRWTFQATRMDGELWGWTIKPDQMQVLNPLLILAFIPIFDQGLYPALEKVGMLKKPLQRLTVGGILAGVAFVISGFLELKLEPTYAVKLVGNQAHLNFVNNVNCSLNMEIAGEKVEIDAMGQYIAKHIEAGQAYTLLLDTSDESCKDYSQYQYEISPKRKDAKSFLISGDSKQFKIQEAQHQDILEKNGEGGALLKFIFIGFEAEEKLNGTLQFGTDKGVFKVYREPEVTPGEEDGHGHGGPQAKAVQVDGIEIAGFDSAIYRTEPMEQAIQLMTPSVETEPQNVNSKTELIGKIKPRQGGNYLYILEKGSAPNQYRITEHVITQPNSVHMLWLVPQYVVITVAEVMFSVTGLQFAFSQAPASMKSVLQAAWLLTVAFGNVIVVFLAEFKIFEEQSKEFFLYSGLMFVDMVIFAVLAYFYVPTDQEKRYKKDDNASPNAVEMKENRGFEPDP